MIPEALPPRVPLPIITSETKQRLLEDLDMDIPEQSRKIVDSIRGEHPQHWWNTVQEFTQNVYADAIESNIGFAQTLNDIFKASNAGMTSLEYQLIGAAVILRAFDIQTGFDLIPSLSRLRDSDLDLMRQVAQKILPDGMRHDITIIDKLLMMPRIPEQQIDLNDSIRQIAGKNEIIGSSFKTGANVMYTLLSFLWPTLQGHSPQQTNPLP